MKTHTIIASDPFEAKRLIHEEEAKRLKDEIVRLKLKCGETFTEKELLFGRFGDAPDNYVIKRPR